MSKQGRGFLTIAQNTTVDYLRLAYVQAMSIKIVMPDSKYAVIVDTKTSEKITDQHRKVFDHVILLSEDHAVDQDWKLNNEWQVFALTPFKETIKLESDILFTRSVKHWWDMFRFRDVVLSLGCRDFLGTLSANRDYRKVFDDNNLPDVYNGIMYFRHSQTAADFFQTAKLIYDNWQQVSQYLLKNCRDPQPTTDLVYALTAQTIGREKTTLPTADFINFTHMKSNINDWPNKPWCKIVVNELEVPMIRINNQNQYHPLHYYEKDWISDRIINLYERRIWN